MKTLLLGALALTAIVSLPGVTLAATYAYVNTAGEVMTTEAPTASNGLMPAPNIGVHSGVMIVDTADDSAVVGDSVSGV
ncbi:MAG: hypothetical protein AAB901_01990 [Patescibacteria group bacterium]